MVKPYLLLIQLFLMPCILAFGQAIDSDQDPESGRYTLIIEGFDWGPAVSRVILEPLDGQDSSEPTLSGNFNVQVERLSGCTKLEPWEARGQRIVTEAYRSDPEGNRQAEGTHVTLELEVSPDLVLSNPFHYSNKDSCIGNDWVEYRLRIEDRGNGLTWSLEKGRQIPPLEPFDLDGRFTSEEGTVMSYAFYSPPSAKEKQALIIWLHGGGEGGTDPSIPLLANRAANYASPEIQEHFEGAYVLVPQCPGAWMHNAEGEVTWGRENDVYNVALMELIRDFVARHPEIDEKRIYVGGCSNGGYMSLKLILLHPDYFAAGFISALAYRSQYLTDEEIDIASGVPIWFIHSRDDGTTLPGETAVPVYKRLKAHGAKNTHLSLYDHVVDISGRFGGLERHYPGHWSWIYSHVNHCRLDFDGSPVKYGGKEVSLMSWLASQRNEQ